MHRSTMGFAAASAVLRICLPALALGLLAPWAGCTPPQSEERVVAFVVPRAAVGPPGLAELRDWVKDELPPWCAPTELVLRREIPRTALGKPRRDALLADLPDHPS